VAAGLESFRPLSSGGYVRADASRPGGVNSLDEQEDESMPGFDPSAQSGTIALIPAPDLPQYRSYGRAPTGLSSAAPWRQYLAPDALPEEGLEKLISTGRAMKREEGAGWADRGLVRILDDEEVLCLFNSHGSQNRSADVLVDAVLNRTTEWAP